MEVYNPATDRHLIGIEEDTLETILSKFEKAKKAQKDWAKTPLKKRIAAIEKFKALVIEEKDNLARVLTNEVGKPITQSQNELNGLITRIEYFLKETPKVLKEEKISGKEDPITETISKEPLGVIGNISAWNYPYFVGSNVFIPALLTGNAVLYKPSEFASCTGTLISQLMHDAGVPADVFALVIGTGTVGEDLLKLPLDGVFFTGSYATGKKINSLVASNLTKVQLELGGKDPSYVCEDIEVKNAAASLADGAFYNNGQSCCSVERIYVHESIYEPFVEVFLSEVKNFVVGDPLSPKTYLGPLTRAAQIEVLEAQIQDAIRKGAKLEMGGKKIIRAGNYFEPTVLTNVSHDMLLMKEESFGPVIGIQKVKNDDEAISLMNDTAYGLTASVYTKDEKRAENILKQIHAGTVYWNCCDRVSPRLPWAGRGHSGIGCTLSHYGIETFLRLKAWHLKKLG
ncbi:MAG: aldehyde dehydrogenase family protein [Deltaproteobacteria bacterium]|nr:aldehyde dehydrogenase family protein [Deltaproteobacteria bacterium]